MTQMKRSKPTDFADILAALDQGATQRAFEPRSDRARRHDDQINPEAASRPAPRLRTLLGRISWPWRNRAGESPFASAALYEEEAAEPATESPRATTPEPPSNQPPQTEDEAIAEELGLRADLATVDLQRIRRNFAKKNHPDRFAPAQRVGAARRMSIANMLIDEHLKQKPPAP